MEEILKNIQKHWAVLKRRKILSLCVSMLVATVAISFIFTLPYKYKADSTVFIEQNVINNLVKGLAVTPDAESKIRVLRYAMLSRSMIGDVLKKMDPVLLPAGLSDLQPFITSLQNRTNIRIRGQDLFTVSLQDAKPEFARDYINLLVTTYVEQNIERTRNETYGANRFLDEQVTLFKQKLDAAENAIIQFRKKHGVYVAVSEDKLLQEIRQHEETLEATDIDLETLTAKNKEIQRQLKRVSPTISIMSQGGGNQRAILIQQQIMQLKNIYTDEYPEIIRLQSELAALQSQPRSELNNGATSTLRSVNPIYQTLQQQKAEIDSEISALKAKKLKLAQMIENRRDDLRFIPENKKKLALLEKDKVSLQAVYTDLLNRMSQAEVSKQMEIGNKTTTFRVVDPAILPQKHASPNIPLLILLAIAGSLAAGVLIAVVWETLDTSVKHVDDLPLFDNNIPVMGMISQIPLAADLAREQKRTHLIFLVAGSYYAMALGLFAYMSFFK